MLLGSLSKGVFERENETLSLFICHNAFKFVLLSVYSLLKVRLCSSSLLTYMEEGNDLTDTIFRRRDWLWKLETSRMKTVLLRFILDAPCRSLDRAQCLLFFFCVHKWWLNKLMRCSYWSLSWKWWECYWTLCTVNSKKSNRNITKKSNGLQNHCNILTMKTHNNSNMTITLNIPSQFLPIYPTAHVHS